MGVPNVSRSVHANGNILPTIQCRGIPKASSLTGHRNVLSGKNLDLRYMDISVDDGTDAKLDEGARCIRFLSAAANVDTLLRSPTRHQNGSTALADTDLVGTSSSSESSDTANVTSESQGSTNVYIPEEPTDGRKEQFKKLLAFFEEDTETASSYNCPTGALQNKGNPTVSSEFKASSDTSSETIHQDVKKNRDDQASSRSNRIPKVSSLTRDESTFTHGKLDAGHLDISVDDGANVALDKGIRSIRFFSAASNIDAIFGSQESSQNASVSNGAVPSTPSNSGSGTDEADQDLRKANGKHKLPALHFRSGKSAKGKEYICIEPVTPSNLRLMQEGKAAAGGTSHSISDNSATLKKVPAIPERLNEIHANPIDLDVVDAHDSGEKKPLEQAKWDCGEMSSPVSPIKLVGLSSKKWGQSTRGKTFPKHSSPNERTSRIFTPKRSTTKEPDHKPNRTSLEMMFSRNSRTTRVFPMAKHNGKEDACEERASNKKLDTMIGSSKREQTPRSDRTEGRQSSGAQNLLGSCFPLLDVPGNNEQHLNSTVASPCTQTDSQSNHISTKIRGPGASEWIRADASRYNPMVKPDLQRHETQQSGEQSGSSERTSNGLGRRNSWKIDLQTRAASVRGRMQLYISRLTD